MCYRTISFPHHVYFICIKPNNNNYLCSYSLLPVPVRVRVRRIGVVVVLVVPPPVVAPSDRRRHHRRCCVASRAEPTQRRKTGTTILVLTAHRAPSFLLTPNSLHRPTFKSQQDCLATSWTRVGNVVTSSTVIADCVLLIYSAIPVVAIYMYKDYISSVYAHYISSLIARAASSNI